MSIRKEMQTVPARQEEKVVERRCDLCGRAGNPWGGWNTSTYDVAKTDVGMEMGTSYPDDYHTTETVFDICPDCFTTKLIPWLKSQGAEPRIVGGDED
jgi:hypothetical protein